MPETLLRTCDWAHRVASRDGDRLKGKAERESPRRLVDLRRVGNALNGADRTRQRIALDIFIRPSHLALGALTPRGLRLTLIIWGPEVV
jgi:hypothetical protein